MSVISILDNQYARLVYYTQDKIVHHTFHKPLDSTHFRLVLNAGVDLLGKYGATKWLSDNRAIDPHSDEDNAWANTEWVPRAIAAGWKYWALVVPHDIKARMNLSGVVNSFFEKGIRVMVFIDPDEAMTWLQQIDQM